MVKKIKNIYSSIFTGQKLFAGENMYGIGLQRLGFMLFLLLKVAFKKKKNSKSKEKKKRNKKEKKR